MLTRDVVVITRFYLSVTSINPLRHKPKKGIPKTSFRNKSQTPNNTSDHAKRKSEALSPGSSIFSCKASRDGDHDDQQNPTTNETHQSWKHARRNVMIGLGGLYGSRSTCWMPSEHPLSAIATPIPPLDISKCHDASKDGDEHDEVNCCPPEPTIIDYVPPPVTCLRVRRPAHSTSCEYIAKYNKATELMKNLPLSDPRNFMQQANVHCA
ncbi:hypothetical protein L484_000891 [Morus notabilis]|uniref:Uncharacterized protein n=1 Tax=Morus notabilis TaxID=981085 RepID=W9QW13_9ROSA|nr:hypothetical protein L484_000891 [Morus notabilis]